MDSKRLLMKKKSGLRRFLGAKIFELINFWSKNQGRKIVSKKNFRYPGFWVNNFGIKKCWFKKVFIQFGIKKNRIQKTCTFKLIYSPKTLAGLTKVDLMLALAC